MAKKRNWPVSKAALTLRVFGTWFVPMLHGFGSGKARCFRSSAHWKMEKI